MDFCYTRFCSVILPACAFVAIFFSEGKAQTLPEKSLYQQTSEMHHLMQHYEADYRSLDRFYFIRHSPERRERLKKLAGNYLEQLKTLNFEAFSTGGKVDLILFRRDLREQLHALQMEAEEFGKTRKWVKFADAIYDLEKQRRRGASLDGQQTGALLSELASDVRQAGAELERSEGIDSRLAAFARETVEGLREALESVYDFYLGYDPAFTWWAPAPYKELDTLLKHYDKLLKSKSKIMTTQRDDKSGIKGIPIGRAEIIRQLEYEMIPYTPEELIAIANKEFAWCAREMLKASGEMGFGKNWKKALEKVKNTYVPAGRQPQLILRLYEESVAFLKENDLITIPPVAEETWRMIMMTPERQLVNPFFTGGEVISISYPTNTMEQEDKLMSMRGNNPHFSRATVHHELIAGHHLQQFMNRRYKAYRDFSTPFWTEGWSLYWEMLLWDLGFPESPEDRVGMLFWRMHRCARIIFSLNYHLGKWTPQQCIDFLVESVGHEYANAEGEVRRSFVGGYSPLYQVAYMIGGLQFYALKQALVDSGKMTFREFHDAIMRENNMPVEMVRAILTEQAPARDFKSSWKFYQE